MNLTKKHETILKNLYWLETMSFKKEYLETPSKELDIKIRRILALIKAGYINTDVCQSKDQDCTIIGLSATGYGVVERYL